jgi:hypothetical protein
MSNFQTIDNTLQRYLLQERYINTAVYLFLILYAGLAAPKLPSYVSNLFNNAVFRLVVLFLIAYLSSKNVEAAILVSVGLVVTMMTLNHHMVNDKISMLLNLKKEGYTPLGDNSMSSYAMHAEPVRSVEQFAPRENINEPFDGPEYATI